jgi:hypothetical protein
MKRFAEWTTMTLSEQIELLLLERKFDQEMRTAALKMWKGLSETLMSELRSRTAEFVKQIAANPHKAKSNLFDAFLAKFCGSSNRGGVKVIVANKKTHIEIRLKFSKDSIVLPPSIKKGDGLQKRVNKNVRGVPVNMFSSLANKPLMISLSGDKSLSQGTYRSFSRQKVGLGSVIAGVLTAPVAPWPWLSGDSSAIAVEGVAALSLVDGNSALNQFKQDCLNWENNVLARRSGSNKRVDPTSMLREMVRKLLGSIGVSMEQRSTTFFHEYIHFLDDVRAPQIMFSKNSKDANSIDQNDDTAWKKYYTSDSEWNAFFQAEATAIERSVRFYLAIMTSDAIATHLRNTSSPNFNELSDIQKCKLMSRFVVASYRDRQDDMISSLSRALPPDAGTYLKGIPYKGTAAQCLLSMERKWFAREMLKDPKLRMKFLNRVLLLSDEIEGILKSYQDSMSGGKVPKESDFRSAKAVVQAPADELSPYYILRLESQRTRIAYANMPFNPKRIYGAA